MSTSYKELLQTSTAATLVALLALIISTLVMPMFRSRLDVKAKASRGPSTCSEDGSGMKDPLLTRSIATSLADPKV
jgi:hypothetical protein